MHFHRRRTRAGGWWWGVRCVAFVHAATVLELSAAPATPATPVVTFAKIGRCCRGGKAASESRQDTVEECEALCSADASCTAFEYANSKWCGIFDLEEVKSNNNCNAQTVCRRATRTTADTAAGAVAAPTTITPTTIAPTTTSPTTDAPTTAAAASGAQPSVGEDTPCRAGMNTASSRRAVAAEQLRCSACRRSRRGGRFLASSSPNVKASSAPNVKPCAAIPFDPPSPQQVAACAKHSPTTSTETKAHCAVVTFSLGCVDGCGWSPARASCAPRATAGAEHSVVDNPGTAYQPHQLPTPALGCGSKGGEDSWANAGWHKVGNSGMVARWHPLRLPWAAADKFCRGHGPGFGLLDGALWEAHDSFRSDYKNRNPYSYKDFWLSGGTGGKGCTIVLYKGSGKQVTDSVPCDSSHAYICAGSASTPWPGPRTPPIDGARTTRRPAGKRRNVVVMMADDWGWGDLPGKNDDAIMPHIKDMQQHSVQFERFYVSAPVCSPTRSTVLTGLFPARTGVTIPNASGGGHTDSKVKRTMKRSLLTISEALKPLSYRAGAYGKWHLGNMLKGTNLGHPGERLVDDWIMSVRSVSPVNLAYMYDSDLCNMKHCGEVPGQSSMIMARRANRLVDRATAAGEPFLAQVWFHEPHVPIRVSDDFIQMYKDRPGFKSDDKQIMYWATLSAIDAAVGSIRNNLRANGVEKDTMVMLLSDNGPDFRANCGGKLCGSVGPLQGRKFQCTEGGIRVPFLIEVPGIVPVGGRLSHKPVSVADIFPTILDYAGYDNPHLSSGETQKFDGESVWGVVNASAGTDAEFAAAEDKLTFPIGFNYKGDWGVVDRVTGYKYGSFTSGGGLELYDIDNDPGESKNVKGQNGSIASKLAAMYSKLELWD